MFSFTAVYVTNDVTGVSILLLIAFMKI
jgi:hypothetical protein